MDSFIGFILWTLWAALLAVTVAIPATVGAGGLLPAALMAIALVGVAVEIRFPEH